MVKSDGTLETEAELGVDKCDTGPGEWGFGVGSRMAHVFYSLDEQNTN